MTLESLAQSYQVAVLTPEIVLTISALVVLLAGTFFRDSWQRWLLPLLALAGTVASAYCTGPLWNQEASFGSIYVVDNFALFFKWVFLIGLAMTILLSGRFLDARRGDVHTVGGEYYALLMLSTVGMMMVAGANDLLVVFLGIETLSIALYILAGFARTRLMSNEAALKYFLLGAFATGFLLYGIALTYFATGSTLLPEISDALARPRATAPPGIFSVGLALILIGLGFKAALVPFHQWTPDVYEGSPTPVTAFMAVGAKAAAFAALLRVFPGAFGAAHISAQWHSVLMVIAVLTMTVGNVVAIQQNSLKRMLAYSSIAHAGYLLIGVLTAGSAVRAGDLEGALNANASVLFYLVIYTLMNLGAFAVLVLLESRRDRQSTARDDEHGSEDSEDANILLQDIHGLAWRQPVTAVALTIFLLSLAGIPPTAGFFGKLYLFQGAIHQGLVGLIIVAVLNTVISVYYYLRPVVTMYMQDEAEPALSIYAAGDGTVAVPTTSGLSLSAVAAITICIVLVLGMSVLQVSVLNWAKDATIAVIR